MKTSINQIASKLTDLTRTESMFCLGLVRGALEISKPIYFHNIQCSTMA